MKCSVLATGLGFMLLFSSVAHANNLGVIGEVFQIKEPDLLQEIHQKLTALEQSGQLNAMMQQINHQAEAQIKRPAPSPEITTTSTPRVWLFDPSIVLNQTIQGEKGQVLWPKGTVINPLTRVSINETLIFFNADDSRQVKWAAAEIANSTQPVKPILVQGDWSVLMKAWQRPVYFDQQGKLTTRFGITHVPAKLTQAGLKFRIEEDVPSL